MSAGDRKRPQVSGAKRKETPVTPLLTLARTDLPSQPVLLSSHVNRYPATQVLSWQIHADH